MSIKTLTFLLWRRLSGGSIHDDSQFTYKELREYVVSGILEGLKANYYEQLQSDEYRYGNDSLTTSITQDVQFDEEIGLQYVTVPLKSISVAGNRMLSITSLNPVSTSATQYVPIRQEEMFLSRMQPAIPCVVQFYRQDGKAYFYNQKTLDKKVKVNQKYTLPTDDDADLALPESEGAIIERALRLLGQQFPSDNDNNGAPINRA